MSFPGQRPPSWTYFQVTKFAVSADPCCGQSHCSGWPRRLLHSVTILLRYAHTRTYNKRKLKHTLTHTHTNTYIHTHIHARTHRCTHAHTHLSQAILALYLKKEKGKEKRKSEEESTRKKNQDEKGHGVACNIKHATRVRAASTSATLLYRRCRSVGHVTSKVRCRPPSCRLVTSWSLATAVVWCSSGRRAFPYTISARDLHGRPARPPRKRAVNARRMAAMVRMVGALGGQGG